MKQQDGNPAWVCVILQLEKHRWPRRTATLVVAAAERLLLGRGQNDQISGSASNI
jgi:hypothetical protein